MYSIVFVTILEIPSNLDGYRNLRESDSTFKPFLITQNITPYIRIKHKITISNKLQISSTRLPVVHPQNHEIDINRIN